MSLSEVIVFGVVLNVTAGLGAFAFGWIDDRIGSRRTAALALCGLILASAAAVSVETRPWLWVAACFIGVFVGPVQSASRALMARLAPAERQAEYFGLLALSGKATAFAGPAVVAAVTQATGSQRLGLATILAFLVTGLALLLWSGRYVRRPPSI
jgi:UMF1 family MFS transporter